MRAYSILRYTLPITVIAGSLVLILLLLVFPEQIAALLRISPQVLGIVSGSLAVGFWEGVVLLRDVYREHGDRKLKHYENLKPALTQ